MRLTKNHIVGIIIVVFFILFIYIYKNKNNILERLDSTCKAESRDLISFSSHLSTSDLSKSSSVIFDLYTYLDYLRKTMPTKYKELINDINLNNGVLDIQDKSYIKYESFTKGTKNEGWHTFFKLI